MFRREAKKYVIFQDCVSNIFDFVALPDLSVEIVSTVIS